jgi:hypothetical protein
MTRKVSEIWEVWEDIESLTQWLNDSNGFNDHEMTLRIMKIGEEFGEVVNAHIGAIGQNPRKGFYATQQDVIKELCDVIVTAMVAMNSMTGDATISRGMLAAHMTHLIRRAGEIQAA